MIPWEYIKSCSGMDGCVWNKEMGRKGNRNNLKLSQVNVMKKPGKEKN